MAGAEIRSSGPGFAIGVWRNLVVVGFTTTPSEAAARDMATIAAEVAAAEGHLGMVHLVHTTKGAPPNAAARSHYVSMMRELNDAFVAGAVVAAGQGFVSSIVRSVIAGFTIAARPKFPLKVFAEVSVCGAWLAEKMSADAAELTAAIEATRDAIGALAPNG